MQDCQAFCQSTQVVTCASLSEATCPRRKWKSRKESCHATQKSTDKGSLLQNYHFCRLLSKRRVGLRRLFCFSDYGCDLFLKGKLRSKRYQRQNVNFISADRVQFSSVFSFKERERERESGIKGTTVTSQ